ncbi:DUF4397 domain-containing protein [Streptomyces sp. RKND-216]|uniref:DUF4397 domain-containing protein n=1 Tax=Streptomyces sp. RKND-216 TaxID=2562581 RepID=UPI00109E3072|nr:DUF4397 domain-containing protein [Streptomyces sp. RKND-216]THA23380.1 DUF4397 domain-containing protein [Streptomyces sp. RKND-216]THA27414.1 DUF4397 domain-containing protein [Streptomyces sp. RKND-216]
MSSRIVRAACTLAASGVLALALAPVAPAAPAEGAATVTVFHGIPGTPVDVYADGKELLSDFQPGTLTDPLTLPAGSYDIEVFAVGTSPSSGDPVVEKQIDVPGGANASVTANLSEGGQPALNAYVNDVSTVPDGKSRLTVRHVAAAPAVDVRADGQAVFKDLKNPGEATGEVPAGTVNADVTLAGTGEVVIGPAKLDLADGASTIVYAWGSAEDDNLALKVQTLTTGSKTPGAPSAGGAGAAVANDDAALYAAAAGAGLVALIAGVRLAHRRR